MNYIGSKKKLLPWIIESVEEEVGNNLSNLVFCDLFAGTGIVGRGFKGRVGKVISNDLEAYSYVLNKNYIGNTKVLLRAKELIDELNSIDGTKGFIFNHYCLGGGDHKRQYFSDNNGKKIDAIRQKIEEWKITSKISDDEYYFLLTSLIESADKVANVASVYGAYLKHLKKSAQKDFVLEAAEFEAKEGMVNEIFNEDSNSLIYHIEGDILYLDPPYNQRQYASNYHLLNTIAKYDTFMPQGKTGLRENYNKSQYCKKREVVDAFEDLISSANFKYIFVSYNNEGLMSIDKIKEIMSKYGEYSLKTKEYGRFVADKKDSREYSATTTFEHLSILKKR